MGVTAHCVLGGLEELNNCLLAQVSGVDPRGVLHIGDWNMCGVQICHVIYTLYGKGFVQQAAAGLCLHVRPHPIRPGDSTGVPIVHEAGERLYGENSSSVCHGRCEGMCVCHGAPSTVGTGEHIPMLLVVWV